MIKTIRQLFALLTPKQRKQFYVLQCLVVLMAFAELVGIASIAPFMALVGDISLLEQGGIYTKLYKLSGLENPIDFLFYTGFAVLVALTISTTTSMYTIWRLSLFGARVGTEIADRLYAHYMQQNWLFHASGSSAQLTKQVATEAVRVTGGIIQPLMQMNAKLVLVGFIAFSILVYEPAIALVGLCIFSCAYVFLYKLVRKRLDENGKKMSEISTLRFRLMNEGFGGIKDVLLLHRSKGFIGHFQESGKVFSQSYGTNIAIGQVPRYLMELVAFGAMISLTLLLIKFHEGNLGLVLPVLGVYALAAFKLLPAFQQIYSSVTQIKGNTAAFEAIKTDLMNCQNQQNKAKATQCSLPLTSQVSLQNISFTYPNKQTPAVENLTIDIPVNSVVGLVGASGSGKSTAIDLLLWLLTPQKGQLMVDGVAISEDNKRAWQDKIGFVSQSIFLSEGTIAENVAFGLAANEINTQQVHQAIKLANLNELVEQLPKGINTKVGERGVQLSGGQRQRIGIARALYNNAEVLVFDEATSALDGITEKVIMDAIHSFSGKKTIVMIAHRLKTVQKCDMIYLMESSKVVDKGTFEQLVNNNSVFKKMAEHS